LIIFASSHPIELQAGSVLENARTWLRFLKSREIEQIVHLRRCRQCGDDRERAAMSMCHSEYRWRTVAFTCAPLQDCLSFAKIVWLSRCDLARVEGAVVGDWMRSQAC
jgi:hypothetical protein